MSALYQLSDGSEGTQPDGSGSHQNGSINLSDSEAERSAQQLFAFSGLPGSKGQAIHLTGGVFTPNVAAQLPAPPAINIGGEETTSLLHPLNTPMSSLSPVSSFNGDPAALSHTKEVACHMWNVPYPVAVEAYAEDHDTDDTHSRISYDGSDGPEDPPIHIATRALRWCRIPPPPRTACRATLCRTLVILSMRSSSRQWLWEVERP